MSGLKKLNIAIFHLAFVYSGGGEKLVLQQAQGLKKLGHKVDIYSSVVDINNCFPEVLKRIKIKKFLPIPNWKNHEGFLVFLSALMAPFYFWRFRKYDVVLACNQPSSWIALWPSLILRIPYITYIAQPTRILYPRKIDDETGLRFTKNHYDSLTARFILSLKNIVKVADTISVQKSHTVCVNGDYMAGIVSKVYKTKGISNPAGVELPPLTKSRKPYLLITNRHFPQKRFEYGIFVISSIITKFPEYRLLITGAETFYTKELKVLVKRLNLEEKVVFLGYVNQKKLIDLYRDASIYLYTAPEEDFGMGVIEAMSCGCPVVAVDFGGPSEVITHGFDGLLSKKDDLSDFIQNCERIIKNPKLANRLGKNARYTVKNRFSFQKHIKEIEKQLLEAL